jgi:GNAT superfamily N-acetyltransferase
VKRNAVRIRPAEGGDEKALGHVLQDAFTGIAERHGFATDFPSGEYAQGLAATLISAPAYRGVVAEVRGRVAGTAFVNVSDPVRGIGPVAVAPEAQGRGVGRALMEAVMEVGAGGTGLRLTQDGFNLASLTLYTSLGFDVKEPLVLRLGRPHALERPHDGVHVRRLRESDLDACADLCNRIHGIERRAELRLGVATGLPGHVAERDGRLVAYATTVALWQRAHGMAETSDDLLALLTGAAHNDQAPIALLVPTRDAALHAWCVRHRLRAVKPMNLMAHGEYQEPRGAWFPSVAY